MATITSHGAAQTVTGSCHLLEINNKKILIDCGMFQGHLEQKNYEPFGFDAKNIDYVLITHAHLDHVGRLPKLVKEGFEGVIIATSATLDLAQIILLDSAKIMKEDFKMHYKKAQRRGKEHTLQAPLYEKSDVDDLFALSRIISHYEKSIKLCKGVEATFHNAGHILGSAFIELKLKEKKAKKRIIFSGDIGNTNDMVLPNLVAAPKADYLYVESTYGDRNHQGIDNSIKELQEIITSTLQNDGNVIIPSFAIERTQEILCILKDMYKNGTLPQCRIFLDSPMATKATQTYTMHSKLLSKKCRKNKKEDGLIFDFKALEYSLTQNDSKKVNLVDERAIIIAGSGMCNGGRIVHHLKHRIWNAKNAIIFVGYQAEGTLGRKIIEGAKFIKLYHEEIKVTASIHTINGFSAHADQSEILSWVGGIKGLKRAFLIHGEKEKQKVLKEVMKTKLKLKSHIVELDETIYI